MKILLTKDIKKLGEIGKIIEVNSGYAKNYLIPTKKAIIANKENLLKFIKIKIDNKTNNVDDKINNTSIIIPVTPKNDNEIYGSITPKSLAKIFKKLNLQVNSKNINKNISIRKIGKYKLEIKNKKTNNINNIYIILIKNKC